jgi:hypothetical protein
VRNWLVMMKLASTCSNSDMGVVWGLLCLHPNTIKPHSDCNYACHICICYILYCTFYIPHPVYYILICHILFITFLYVTSCLLHSYMSHPVYYILIFHILFITFLYVTFYMLHFYVAFYMLHFYSSILY